MTIRKKLLAVALIAVMAFNYLPAYAVAKEPSNPFDDVKESDWFYDAVQYVKDEGLMKGTSADTFSPQMMQTRAMFITILYRLHSPEETSSLKPSFSDVKSSDWFYDAVAWAERESILKGDGTGKFLPYKEISREQIAVLVIRYTNRYGFELDNSAAIDDFKDLDQCSDYALEYVKKIQKSGIIKGNGAGSFEPKRAASRAEAASGFQRLALQVKEQIKNEKDKR